jgi:hypothetical protein
MSYDDDEESLEYGCGFALGALLGPLAVIPLLLLGGGLVAAVAMLLQALCLWILSLPVMLAAIVVAVFDFARLLRLRPVDAGGCPVDAGVSGGARYRDEGHQAWSQGKWNQGTVRRDLESESQQARPGWRSALRKPAANSLHRDIKLLRFPELSLLVQKPDHRLKIR